MTDLSPQPQPVVGPVQIGIASVTENGGSVSFQVQHLNGLFLFAIPAKQAADFGKQIQSAARTAMLGLTVIGAP